MYSAYSATEKKTSLPVFCCCCSVHENPPTLFPCAVSLTNWPEGRVVKSEHFIS